jgi:hypothetical protein
MATVDDICPSYVGAKRIKLLRASTETARAFTAIDLDVSIDATADTDGVLARVGLVLPLELTVTSPSAENFYRHVYRRFLPTSVTFVPHEGGRHRVVLREVFHNRFFGAIDIDIAGETTDPRAIP